MCAPNAVTGRWIITQRPSIRCGSSAASLSSGDITTPRRSNWRKSSVNASETPGPPQSPKIFCAPCAHPVGPGLGRIRCGRRVHRPHPDRIGHHHQPEAEAEVRPAERADCHPVLARA